MRIIRNLLFVLVTLEPSQILAESIENLNDNVADWVMIQPGNSRTFEAVISRCQTAYKSMR